LPIVVAAVKWRELRLTQMFFFLAKVKCSHLVDTLENLAKSCSGGVEDARMWILVLDDDA
jgi:hypothetical protein